LGVKSSRETSKSSGYLQRLPSIVPKGWKRVGLNEAFIDRRVQDQDFLLDFEAAVRQIGALRARKAIIEHWREGYTKDEACRRNKITEVTLENALELVRQKLIDYLSDFGATGRA
jgi:DNA-directed RNA polymerase specialized sigma24 family protein